MLFVLLLIVLMTGCASQKPMIEVQNKLVVPPRDMYICDLKVDLVDPKVYSVKSWEEKEDTLFSILTDYVKKSAICNKQLLSLEQWFKDQKVITEKNKP